MSNSQDGHSLLENESTLNIYSIALKTAVLTIRPYRSYLGPEETTFIGG